MGYTAVLRFSFFTQPKNVSIPTGGRAIFGVFHVQRVLLVNLQASSPEKKGWFCESDEEVHFDCCFFS